MLHHKLRRRGLDEMHSSAKDVLPAAAATLITAESHPPPSSLRSIKCLSIQLFLPTRGRGKKPSDKERNTFWKKSFHVSTCRWLTTPKCCAGLCTVPASSCQFHPSPSIRRPTCWLQRFQVCKARRRTTGRLLKQFPPGCKVRLSAHIKLSLIRQQFVVNTKPLLTFM